MIDKIYKDLVLVNTQTSIIEEQSNYILPQDMEEDEILSGIVTHKGPDATSTEVGEVVVFGQFDYSVIMIEGVKYAKMKEDNLICKLKANE